MPRFSALLLPLVLFACARPSERIATALIDYGIPQSRAACMGERLERDLTIGQLRELSSLVRAYRQNDPTPGRLTSQDLLGVAAQVRDPQVPITVGKAAAACGLLY